jgi:hypothetical protein
VSCRRPQSPTETCAFLQTQEQAEGRDKTQYAMRVCGRAVYGTAWQRSRALLCMKRVVRVSKRGRVLCNRNGLGTCRFGCSYIHTPAGRPRSSACQFFFWIKLSVRTAERTPARQCELHTSESMARSKTEGSHEATHGERRSMAGTESGASALHLASSRFFALCSRGIQKCKADQKN